MLIAEFLLDSPLLRTVLREAPDVQATVEEYYQQNDTLRVLLWVEGGDLARFEQALGSDPMVTESIRLTEVNDRRLYRVDYTEEASQVATFPLWSELDLVMFELKGTNGRWKFRMGFPDRDTFVRYQQVCEERGLDLDLRAIYDQADRHGARAPEVTSRQLEALVTALDEGYYEIPRDITLSELAEELEISRQATSERLRRGTATVLRTSLTSYRQS